jgi:hypothetical protein
MALTKNLLLIDNFGEEVLINKAYIKVDKLSGNKSGLTIVVCHYKNDKSTFLTKKEFSFTPNLEGLNFIAQAYDHLKTLLEFADAGDC